jgi:hypothetical protein
MTAIGLMTAISLMTATMWIAVRLSETSTVSATTGGLDEHART